MKLTDRNTLYVLESEPLFYQQDISSAILPHLKLVDRFPQAFPIIRIDRGAIRFVLSGATLMAPGLTSNVGGWPGDGRWRRGGRGSRGVWEVGGGGGGLGRVGRWVIGRGWRKTL